MNTGRAAQDPIRGYLYLSVSETRYIYDANRVIQERDGSNNPLVSYSRGNDLSGSLEGAGGIGGLLARSSGYSAGNWTTHDYYFADGNGNITFMTDASQLMAASYRYDPFGNTLSSSGTLASANVYRFSSKEIHVNTGMYYYLYRFYDPNLQRWLNRDPLGERGNINLYGFANNRPTGRIDPYGLQDPGPGSSWGGGPPAQEPGGQGPSDEEGNEEPRAGDPYDGLGSMSYGFSQMGKWAGNKFGCFVLGFINPPAPPPPRPPGGTGCSLCPVNNPTITYPLVPPPGFRVPPISLMPVLPKTGVH